MPEPRVVAISVCGVRRGVDVDALRDAVTECGGTLFHVARSASGTSLAFAVGIGHEALTLCAAFAPLEPVCPN